jgi:hypothetical protein
VGAIETGEEFGYRIDSEAWRRVWEWAKLKVILGDGAVCPVTDPQPGIWNPAHQHFPGAIQIVDLYHPATFLHP